MKRAVIQRTVAFAGAAVLALLTVAAARPAAADPASPGDAPKPVAVTKVIDRTSEKIPVDVTAVKALQASELAGATNPQAVAVKPVPLPDGVTLQPGETLQVNYSNGVAVHQAITAACTSTSTVDTPYVSGGYAWSYHSHGISSGCSNSASVNGILSSYAPPLWWQRDFQTVTVTPGSSLYWATNKKCVNSGSKTWHSENAIGSSDTALSPDKNLACNPG